MEEFVGSESASDYFNIQNLGAWRDGLFVCYVLSVLLIEWLCGLFVVVVFVIDFTID